MSIPKYTIAAIVSWLSQRRPKELFLFFSLVALLPATFSVGFHHPDEQFSIIELMNYKLGNVGPEVFNWDFHLKIRPFIQVYLYTFFYKVFSFIGGESPFLFIGIIRYFNLIFGLGALYVLTQSPVLRKNIKSDLFSKDNWQKVVFIITALTWFVPYILVRTSSESLSASLFIYGLALLLRTNLLSLIAGVLMGLSFATRFQMGIPAFGVFLWFIFVLGKGYWKQGFIMAIGVCLGATALGFFDYWGYGEWVFSPWNYFRENLIYKKVNTFGVKPFYYFFTKGIVKGAVFPAMLGLGASILFMKRNIKSAWPWILLPYLLIHMFIGHKEVRFLNFLYVLTPIFLALVWRENSFKGQNVLKNIAIGVNIIALVRVCFFPVYKPLKIYRTIFNDIPKEEIIYTSRNDGGHLNLQMRFYVKNERKLVPKSFGELDEVPRPYYLLTSRFDERLLSQGLGCKEIDSIYPSWVYQMNYFNWLKRSAIWTLWTCP